MLSMRKCVSDILAQYSPVSHVHVETFFFSKKFCNGSDVNLILRAAIYQLLREKNITYTLHGPAQWKRFIVGRVQPTKSDIDKHGKTKASKAIVVDALTSKYNIRFPSHIRLAGRRVQFKYDISDAVAIGLYGMIASTPGVTVEEYYPPGEITVQLSALASAV